MSGTASGSRPLARRALVVGGCSALAVVAALAGDAAGGALRAVAVVALLGAGAAALRRAPAGRPPGALAVEERHLLAKDAGVAVIAHDRRRLLVGFGPEGVRLLADLGGAADEVAP